MPINIHGKQYVTVDERVAAIHEDLQKEKFNITTEIVSQGANIFPLVMRATLVIDGKGTFTGYSALLRPTKAIEQQSPYEIVETSAVGRALGFAGYGVVGGIATADEIAAKDGFDTHVAEPVREEVKPIVKVADKAAYKDRCENCDVGVTKAVAEFSRKQMDKVLCFSCQNKLKKENK